MTLENSRVLYNQFLKLGRQDLADQQVKNYPQLATEKPKEEPKVEVKKNVQKPKR